MSPPLLPSIVSIGTALPPMRIGQEQALSLLLRHYDEELTQRSREVTAKVFAHPGVRTRHVSCGSPEELLSLRNEDPDARVERFTRWAVRLSREAIERACAKAGIGPRRIDVLIVNTCTGYICPGISTYLVEAMDLDRSMRLYDLVGSGCGGALPNLQLAADILERDAKAAVACVSVEICSATFEMGNDIALIISNAIFGDGAAAVILKRADRGFALHGSRSFFDPGFRDDVRYAYRNGRLHNRISPRLPRVIGETVPPVIRSLLDDHGVSVEEVAHWCIHPGGDKVITSLRESLGLSDDDVARTRSALERYGNMSSPTVLFELEELMNDGVSDGDWCVITAFGAGLSVHSSLLRYHSA